MSSSLNYLNHFLKGEMLAVNDGSIPVLLLIAVSLGSVFMGAMTYIGNGPNFMVKAIAEQEGIEMPSFFGYMFKYSIPVSDSNLYSNHNSLPTLRRP